MIADYELLFRVRDVLLPDNKCFWLFHCNWPDSENPHVRNATIDVLDWLAMSFGPANDGAPLVRWKYWLDEASDFSGTITIAFNRKEDAALFTLTHRVAGR